MLQPQPMVTVASETSCMFITRSPIPGAAWLHHLMPTQTRHLESLMENSMWQVEAMRTGLPLVNWMYMIQPQTHGLPKPPCQQQDHILLVGFTTVNSMLQGGI